MIPCLNCKHELVQVFEYTQDFTDHEAIEAHSCRCDYCQAITFTQRGMEGVYFAPSVQ
jgi:hypothetical protein